MPIRVLELDYGDERVRYEVQGDTAWGDDHILLDRDDNLLSGTPWASDGYAVIPFIASAEFNTLLASMGLLLSERIEGAGFIVPESLALERYHDAVPTDDAHAKVSTLGPWCYDPSRLGLDVGVINARVSEVLGKRVSITPPHREFPPHFCVRVVRPRSRDNNPPHRDVWLDRLRHAINIYVPLAGSTALSSLPVVPGSHLWAESEIERTVSGARVNGIEFTVPSVVGSTKPLRIVRPDPGLNEFLVFSPYLIHGGAFNQLPDRTRVSLEMRFWREA